ncbi:MAG: hypothetical protein HOP23_02100 [Methylococcaceae bacterium]|nr:hypothetical protein [Methylococcaceae bacterium]
MDGHNVDKRLIRMITDSWLKVVKNECVYTGRNVKRSIAAKDASKKDVRLEHAIPMKVLIEILLTTKNLTAEKVEEILHQFCVVMLITKHEDSLLDASYKSTMPSGWNGTDVYARYTAVGIQF